MTTVIADAGFGIMVCDSQLTTEGAGISHARKVFQIRGELYGIAGEYVQSMSFISWVRDGKKKADPPEMANVQALCLSRERKIYLFDFAPRPYVIDDKVYAIGSGGSFALGALAAGASSRAAIQIAARYDTGTGGRIRSYKLSAKA